MDVRAKFVSKKLSKIRWKKTNDEVVVDRPSMVVSGSWDEEQGNNSVDLWTVDPTSLHLEDSQIDNGGNFGDDFDVPIHMHSVPHTGDVTDLLFLNSEFLLASSSYGQVTLLKCDVLAQRLLVVNVWRELHHFASGCLSSCAALACRDSVFVSVGEDGRINFVDMDSGGPSSITAIENADSTSIADVCFLKQNEVATVNAIGQFKVWDVRQSMRDPVQIHVLGVASGCPVALRCLDQHPTQPHLVATGGQNGELYIWDMRQNKTPATLITCHQSDVWEVHFHPTLPDSLFTCSQDGAIFQWGNSRMKTDIFGQSSLSRKNLGLGSVSTSAKNPNVLSKARGSQSAVVDETASWLMDEAMSRDQLVVKDLLPGHDIPVNSLDVIGNMLVAGTDGDELLIIQKLNVF